MLASCFSEFADRQTDRQTGKHICTDRQTDIYTYRQTHRDTHKHIHTYEHTDIHKSHNWLAQNAVASTPKRTDYGFLEPNKQILQMW